MDDPLQRSTSRAGLLKLGAAAALVLGGGVAGRAVGASNPSPASGEAAGLGDAAVAAPGDGTPVRSPRHLRLSTYLPLVGSVFRINRPGSTALDVKLASATRLRSDIGESFSLIFHAHGNAKLGQETYTLEHPRLGAFRLFVVPVGRGREGQSFEAVVNRIPASLMPRV